MNDVASTILRTALLSNALAPPPDEGIKKCAHHLALTVQREGASVYALSTRGFFSRKFLLEPRILRSLRAARTDVIIYVPTQSATFGSFFRSAVLRWLVGAPVVLVALQPRRLRAIPRIVGRLVQPSLLLTPSDAIVRDARRLGIHAASLEPGVETAKFRPVTQTRKTELRRKYGFPTDRPVLLHVGHARFSRGYDWLLRIGGDVTRVVVIGTSLGGDSRVVELLRQSGVHVIEEFVPDVHEVYQLADVYLFPVRDEHAAIAAPLSVLEAMSCNLPVVTTPFGALPRMFAPGLGLYFADSHAAFARSVVDALAMPAAAIRTREQARRYDWHATADRVLEVARETCATA